MYISSFSGKPIIGAQNNPNFIGPTVNRSSHSVDGLKTHHESLTYIRRPVV